MALTNSQRRAMFAKIGPRNPVGVKRIRTVPFLPSNEAFAVERTTSGGMDVSLPKKHWDWYTSTGRTNVLKNGGLDKSDAVKFGRQGDYDKLPQVVKNTFRIQTGVI